MAEVEKLSLIQILAIKIKKMVGAQIIKRWHCQLGQYQVFSRQKNMWTGFISWMKIRLLTLIRSPSAHAPTWIIRYFSFQPHYQLWRLFNTNWTKIHLCLVATFRELNSLKILKSYSVPSKCSLSFAVRKMYLHLRRFNISNNKQSIFIQQS